MRIRKRGSISLKSVYLLFITMTIISCNNENKSPDPSTAGTVENDQQQLPRTKMVIRSKSVEYNTDNTKKKVNSGNSGKVRITYSQGKVIFHNFDKYGKVESCNLTNLENGLADKSENSSSDDKGNSLELFISTRKEK